MINDQRIAPRPAALRPAVLLAEGGVDVAQEQDRVVLDAVGLGPGAHDKGVVGGQHGHHVDALRAQVGELRNVVREMRAGAGRGEGAGEGEEDDLLVLPLWGGVSLGS